MMESWQSTGSLPDDFWGSWTSQLNMQEAEILPLSHPQIFTEDEGDLSLVDPAVMVARLYEYYLIQGFDARLFEKIQRCFGAGEIEKHLQRQSLCTVDFWKVLGNASLYEDEQSWHDFLNQPNMEQACAQVLQQYIDMKRVNKEAELSTAIDEDSNIVNKTFNENDIDIPILYFALQYMMLKKPKHALIKNIAHHTMLLVGMIGYDFWSQQRAALHILETFGWHEAKAMFSRPIKNDDDDGNFYFDFHTTPTSQMNWYIQMYLLLKYPFTNQELRDVKYVLLSALKEEMVKHFI